MAPGAKRPDCVWRFQPVRKPGADAVQKIVRLGAFPHKTMTGIQTATATAARLSREIA
jgi:hypothetical protein